MLSFASDTTLPSMYDIVFRTRFERTFKKLDAKTQAELLTAVASLADDPYAHPNIRKIAGVRQHAFRLRVGRWRILYFIITKKHTIEVIDLFIKKSNSDYTKRQL